MTMGSRTRIQHTADMVTSGATSKGALTQLASNNPSSPVQRTYVLACLDRGASIAAPNIAIVRVDPGARGVTSSFLRRAVMKSDCSILDADVK